MSDPIEDPPPFDSSKYPHAIRFSPDQRRELLRLGVPEMAIQVIEVEALPAARRRLVRQAPMREVRKELQHVETAVREARNALEALLTPSKVASMRDAQTLLIGGGYRYQQDGIPLNRASQALVPALEVLAVAIKQLPEKPVRHRLADDRPVYLIHDALQKGCLFAGMPFVEVKRGRLAGLSLIAPELRPSTSPTSPFRQIVCICYERLGMPTADPERAVKAFVRRWVRLGEDMAASIRGTEPPSKG